ncbi:MAG: ribosome maturation factor RimP [Oscillospiraceae bacterium]|jgi:ribosome maturation factor RimP|nr:ribosome maturation factor RimP [Oscillospiraceae bacterium]
MADLNTGGIAQRAQRLAEPLAAQLGLTLWDVRFLKEGALWYLRFWIDKPGGVTLDDCEALSRMVDRPLDEADFIAQAYTLEVCSPGIERELTRDEHFAQYVGSLVTVKHQGAGGKMIETVGALAGDKNKQITLRFKDGTEQTIARTKTTTVKLYDDFEEDEIADEDLEDFEEE